MVRGSGPVVAGIVAVVVVAGLGGYLANTYETQRRQDLRVRTLTGGDPDRGRAAIAHRPCGACHEIPGVTGAKARVGPPLTHFAGRVFIGGRVQNTPDNLIRWIEDPHAIDKDSAMPPMGIGEAEARDIAAYLYTLS
jgi:cytochrome c2